MWLWVGCGNYSEGGGVSALRVWLVGQLVGADGWGKEEGQQVINFSLSRFSVSPLATPINMVCNFVWL